MIDLAFFFDPLLLLLFYRRIAPLHQLGLFAKGTASRSVLRGADIGLSLSRILLIARKEVAMSPKFATAGLANSVRTGEGEMPKRYRN